MNQPDWKNWKWKLIEKLGVDIYGVEDAFEPPTIAQHLRYQFFTKAADWCYALREGISLQTKEKIRWYGNVANDPTRSDEDDAELFFLRKELARKGVVFDWDPCERDLEFTSKDNSPKRF